MTLAGTGPFVDTYNFAPLESIAKDTQKTSPRSLETQIAASASKTSSTRRSSSFRNGLLVSRCSSDRRDTPLHRKER